MMNWPETPQKDPFNQPEKLVLPAPSEQYRPAQDSFDPRMTMPIPPEYLVQRRGAPSPQNPLARLRYYWNKDPAYKVLLIAVVLVLVTGTVFAALIANALVHNVNFSTANQALPPPAVVGSANPRPTFAPPGGGKGSKTSSLPPAHGTTPSMQPTPAVPTTTPAGGTLALQINSIPTSVRNYQYVTVEVTTSEPNVTVYLYVRYSVAPHQAFAGPVTSDGNGNATLHWLVTVNRANGSRASVVAIAKDQNGQQAQSQPVSVRISGFSFGD